MRNIPTYMILDGYPVLVDQEDVAQIAKYKWAAVKGAINNPQGRVYFTRYIKSVNKKVYREYLHRMLMECPEGKYVDHINRNTLDCRLSNLRVCTHHVNMVNRSMQGNNKSGTIGVSWLEGRQKWRARIVVNKKSIDLGFFSTKEQAIVARKLGEVTYGYDQLRYQPEQVRMIAEAAWGIKADTRSS